MCLGSKPSGSRALTRGSGFDSHCVGHHASTSDGWKHRGQAYTPNNGHRKTGKRNTIVTGVRTPVLWSEVKKYKRVRIRIYVKEGKWGAVNPPNEREKGREGMVPLGSAVKGREEISQQDRCASAAPLRNGRPQPSPQLSSSAVPLPPRHRALPSAPPPPPPSPCRA